MDVGPLDKEAAIVPRDDQSLSRNARTSTTVAFGFFRDWIISTSSLRVCSACCARSIVGAGDRQDGPPITNAMKSRRLIDHLRHVRRCRIVSTRGAHHTQGPV